ITILDVKVHILTTQIALDYLNDRLKQGEKSVVSTVNTEFIIEAQSNAKFKEQLNKSQLCTADGVGVLWAARLTKYKPRFTNKFFKATEIIAISVCYGIATVVSKASRYKVLPEQITGVDFSERLMELAAKEDLSVFMLGGPPGVAEEAVRNIKHKQPD